MAGVFPTLIQQSSRDASFTQVHGIGSGDATTLAAWQAETEGSFTDAAVAWLFSGVQQYHVIATSDAGLARGPAGSTFREVLGRFFAGGPPEQVQF